MTVLILQVYLKATDIDDGKKISIKMEVGGELLVVTEVETIPRLTGKIRAQKQTNLLVTFSQPTFQQGLLSAT